MLDNSMDVLRGSTEQLRKANDTRESVEDSSNKTELQEAAVKLLKDTLNNTGIRDNKINVKLREVQVESKACK